MSPTQAYSYKKADKNSEKFVFNEKAKNKKGKRPSETDFSNGTIG